MSVAPTGQEHLTPVRITDTSATERRGFRECHREWFLSTVHRLTPNQPSTALFLGTVFHAGLEGFYRAQMANETWPRMEQASLDAYQVAYDRDIEVVRDALGWTASIGLQQFMEAGDLGFQMLQNYHEMERETPLFRRVIAVERRVNVPIRKPGSSRGIGKLSVQADVVGEDSDTGALAVVDHKTASRVMPSAHLDIDDQLTAEVFSWWLATGDFPEKVVYNVAYKRVPDPPKLLKNGQLSRARNQLTTVKMYLDAIHSNGLSVADYADFLAYLKDQEDAGETRLFRREATFRTFEQMAAFERDLYHEFRDMRDVAAHPEKAYPSPSSMNCGGCPVRLICTTIQDDGDVSAVIQAGYVVAPPRR